jgi:hypothetical protein
MVDVKNKMCITCGKRATYGIEGEDPTCCSKHKKPGMEDITHKRCPGVNNQGCKVRANPKFRDYCSDCFVEKYPDDPLSLGVGQHKDELMVKNYIDINIPNIKFLYNKSLQKNTENNTKYRRIDLHIILCNTLLAIEVDEKQHKRHQYNKDDEQRYEDIRKRHGGKCIFIRFNPDKYKNIEGAIVNPPLEERLKRLTRGILKLIERIKNGEYTKQLHIEHLYYDGYK